MKKHRLSVVLVLAFVLCLLPVGMLGLAPYEENLEVLEVSEENLDVPDEEVDVSYGYSDTDDSQSITGNDLLNVTLASVPVVYDNVNSVQALDAALADMSGEAIIINITGSFTYNSSVGNSIQTGIDHVNGNQPIYNNRNITINLGGNTINISSSIYVVQVYVLGGCTFTVSGPGVLNIEGDLWASDGSTFTTGDGATVNVSSRWHPLGGFAVNAHQNSTINFRGSVVQTSTGI